MLFMSIQPDCSSCATSIKRPPLFGLRRGHSKSSPLSSGLPFEPERDRTYGQCRATGTTIILIVIVITWFSRLFTSAEINRLSRGKNETEEVQSNYVA